MNKKISLVILFVLMSVFLTIQSTSVFAKDVNEITLNGKQLSFSADPVISNGTTLVPMRVIFEALGSNVQWNGSDRTITATKGSSTIFLQIDNPSAKINNESKSLQVAPRVINGSTLVPLRFVSESLGAKIFWNSSLKKIIISTDGYGVYKVARVVDGDTFELENGQKVRLIGVDTPESVSPDKAKNTEFGVEASNYSKKALDGQSVYLEKDVSETDKYSRLLRYVYLSNGTMYNEQVVKDGYAKVATYPPDVKYTDLFVKAQQFAQGNNKGLWNSGGFKSGTSGTSIQKSTTGKIKGNINSKGQKIYHVPGGAYYDKTDAEEYFDTEEEAQAAGYRKSSR